MTLALISEATLLYTTHYPTHSTIRSVIKRNKKPVEKKKKKKSNDNDNNKKQPSEILKIIRGVRMYNTYYACGWCRMGKKSENRFFFSTTIYLILLFFIFLSDHWE
jgi:hypothetical protein